MNMCTEFMDFKCQLFDWLDLDFVQRGKAKIDYLKIYTVLSSEDENNF